MSTSSAVRVEVGPDAPRDGAAAGSQSVFDIKKFVNEKAPTSDVHFAATVAYYYQFKASENQRKDAITSRRDGASGGERNRQDSNAKEQEAATNGTGEEEGRSKGPIAQWPI